MKKVQIGFGENALAVIRRLRDASGASSMAEVLRDALGLYDWAREQWEHGHGYAVGAFKEGRFVREVVLFRNCVNSGSRIGGER